jgi:hypothetical protein
MTTQDHPPQVTAALQCLKRSPSRAESEIPCFADRGQGGRAGRISLAKRQGEASSAGHTVSPAAVWHCSRRYARAHLPPRSRAICSARLLGVLSPDHRCRQVKAGDVIVKVGQVNIQNQPLSNLRDLILGEPGTFVVLGFQRGSQVSII